MTHIKKNYNWICSTLIVFIFFVIYMMVREIKPFGEHPFFGIDCTQQVYPFLSVLHDKLRSGDSLYYFWDSGLGGNYLVTYFYYLASPSNLLVALFDKSQIFEFITFSIIIKISLSAGTFGFYLSRRNGEIERDIIIIPLSCAYALSSFFLAYYYESMWLDSFLLFPIIMFGYERLIKLHKPTVYTISLAIAAYCNFYIVYIIGVFLVLWFIFDNHDSFKIFLKNTLWFGVSSVLAAGMAAVSILVSYLGVKSTHIQAEDFPTHRWFGNIFEVIRYQFMFSKLEPIGYSMNQSNIYACTFALVCIFVYFFTKNIKLSERIKKIGLLIFMLISMNESIMNYMWHSFHMPIHVYNRFGFAFIFLVLNMTKDVYDNLRRENMKLMVVGMVIAELLPMISYFFVDFDSVIESKQVLIIALIIILIYSVFLTLISQSEKIKKYASFLLAVFIICELIVNSTFALNQQINYTSELFSDMNQFQEAVDSTQNEDIDSFYRSGFIYEDMMNANALFGVNGIDIFSSIFPFELYRFGKFNGIMGRSNGIKGYGFPETIESLLDEKYIYVHKSKDCYKDRDNYEKVYENERINAYRNKNILPLGFGVKKDILNHTYYTDESFLNENNMITKISGTGEVFNEIFPQYYVDVEGGQLAALETEYFAIKNYIENYRTRSITVSFDITIPGEYYFSPVLDKENEITIYKNDEIVRNLNALLHDDMIYAGKYEEGDKVKIVFSGNVEGYKTVSEETIVLRVAVFDNKMYNSFVNELSCNKMSVNEINGRYVNASVTLDQNQILFTSIPYDVGWSVYENGKKLSMIPVSDAFIGLDIGEGVHELEFRFVPKGLHEGLIISIVSIIIFIVFMICSNKKKLIRKKDNEVKE